MNKTRIVRFKKSEEPLWRQAFDIRITVFVIEQNVPLDLEQDELDQSADHVLLYLGELPIGTGRFLVIDSHAKIGRICVLKEYRKGGYGLELVEELCQIAKDKGHDEIYLGSQVYVIPFYEKLGFEAFGDIFDDAGIPHRMMKRTL